MEIDFHENHLLTPEYLKSELQSLGMEVLHSISVPLKYVYYAQQLLLNNTMDWIYFEFQGV